MTSDVVNVKHFGAIGNGDSNIDDTIAIQAAADEAFGPYDDPHGGISPGGPSSNKLLYFPPGYYYVSSPIAEKAVVSVGGDGSGDHPNTYDKCRITVASTAGLADGDMVLIRGAGGNHFANYSYAIDDVTATTFTLRNVAWVQAAFGAPYAHTYTEGGTVNVPAIKTRIAGGIVYGAGRQASLLRCSTPNAACFSTNGLSNALIKDMSFSAAPGGIAFDYNADGGNFDDPSFHVGATSNTFENLGLGGTHVNTDYGLAMGMGVFMCDSSTVFNCYIGGCDVAGVYIGNQNCLVHSVYGGNIASCIRGIWVRSGSCPTIKGVAFQNYQSPDVIADIVIEGGAADDSYDISGCRTETKNFILALSGPTMSINGCSQATITPGDGFFYSGCGKVTMNGCTSLGGYIEGNKAQIILNTCTFTYADYLTHSSQANFGFLQITPQPVKEITAAAHTIVSSDSGSKIRFNRATGQTVTVSPSGTCFLVAGTKIGVQQTGAGQTTFVGASGVTIRSASGLKLRAQYSCATLTCDGPHLWTLTGDTAV